MANHNKHHNEPKKIHVTCAKRGKTRVTKLRLSLVFHLIGWGRGASFLNQSQHVVKQNQSKSGITFDTQLKTALFWLGNKLNLKYCGQILRPRGVIYILMQKPCRLHPLLWNICLLIHLVHVKALHASLKMIYSLYCAASYWYVTLR